MYTMENNKYFAIFFYKFLQLESRQVMDTCVNLHDTKPNLQSDTGNSRDGSKLKTFTQQKQRKRMNYPTSILSLLCQLYLVLENINGKQDGSLHICKNICSKLKK